MIDEKILVNSSLTSDSDFENPGTSALVESPINANSPSFPIFENSFESNFSPNNGFSSIFQSAVCSKFPYSVL